MDRDHAPLFPEAITWYANINMNVSKFECVAFRNGAPALHSLMQPTPPWEEERSNRAMAMIIGMASIAQWQSVSPVN